MSSPSPLELWEEAEHDHEVYVELMIKHGHLKPRCTHLLHGKARCVLSEGHAEPHRDR